MDLKAPWLLHLRLSLRRSIESLAFVVDVLDTDVDATTMARIGVCVPTAVFSMLA